MEICALRINLKKTWAIFRKVPSGIKFSMIERWPTHPLLGKVFAERIEEKLKRFDPSIRDEVLILFTAHSLPLKVSFGCGLYASGYLI